MIKWFTKEWWSYLFQLKGDDISWITVIKCRLKNHSCGVVWYNPNGLEPDMTCKNCGDNIG